ncbi:hypothetical protein F5Y12DRAFT_432170 [Xylaria sp. FL1777]|nr:hypothetical protein F5Y12DRAFT_432170 [Xylaria sp. FL1777]
MGFYESQPRPRRSIPSPLNTPSRFSRRTDRVEKEGEYIDRWSPKLDHDHYSRVLLHKRRRDFIARHRRRQEHRDSSLMRACTEKVDDVRSLDSFDSNRTSLLSPASSIAFSDLGSTLQNELDDYNDRIKTLQQGEWPAPPNPRSRALRIEGKEFSMQKAKALKSWGLAESLMYGGNSASLRHSDAVHSAASYGVGVIFSAPHHTASTDDTRWVSATDPYNTATPFGVVHSKYRKMIVVKVFGEHCTCLPIYTHNGRGLEGKDFVTEYVSIRDAADRYPPPPEGIHTRLLAVSNPDVCRKIVSGKSSVKLTEFYSHRYDSPATIEGELEDESDSKTRLLELMNLFNS